MKKILLMASGILAFAYMIEAQQAAPANTEITTIHVQGSVYMLQGAGGNVAVQIGEMGVVVVDTGLAQNADKLIAAIRKLSDKPIQYIINTHVHPDHIGGNDAVRRAGVTITGANVAGNLTDATAGAQIIAHENVLNRMSAAKLGSDNWPTDTFFDDDKEVYFNGEAVRVHHVPAAHSDGDSIVHFRRSDVIATGDILTADAYPVIDIARGGSLQGIIDALNVVLDLAVPAHHEEGGTMIVPGHGRIYDEADVAEYRDMMVIFRDRIRDMIKRGMTLEQIKAARPTLDYDPEFGSTSGPWTIDMFVESMYKSLTASKKN